MPGDFNNLRNFILAQQLDRGPDFTQEHQRGKVYDTPTEQMSPSYGSNRRKMTPYEIESQKRDRWLYENSPNATPEDLREFGLGPDGKRMDGKSFTAPFSQGDMWKELEQLTPSAIRQLQKYQQLQELGRVLQQQQQPRSYTRPFEAPTQNQLNNYRQNHPMNRMWNELKNYR